MNQRRLLTVEDMAWMITMGGIRVAAELGHCQQWGSVAVRKGYSLFTGTLNRSSDEDLQAKLDDFALKSLNKNHGKSKDEMSAFAEVIKLFDPPTPQTMNVRRRTNRLDVIAQTATHGEWTVTVVMSAENGEYAKAFAQTMGLMLVTVETLDLVRRPPDEKIDGGLTAVDDGGQSEDESESGKTEEVLSENEGAADDGPPTLIIARSARFESGGL